MKKLKLNTHAFQENALSREQLKKVLGGVADESVNPCTEQRDQCKLDDECGGNLVCMPMPCHAFGTPIFINYCMKRPTVSF